MQHNANNENKTKLAVTVNNRKRERKKRKKSTTTTMRHNWYQVPDSRRAPTGYSSLSRSCDLEGKKKKRKNVYRDVVVFNYGNIQRVLLVIFCFYCVVSRGSQ